MAMQNCRVEMVDGKLVIIIDDITANLGPNKGGRSIRVAFGNISYLNFGGTLNAYRSLKRGSHYENLNWRMVGNRVEMSVIDMSYRGKRGPKGNPRLAHAAETIDGDLTVQLTLWHQTRSMW